MCCVSSFLVPEPSFFLTFSTPQIFPLPARLTTGGTSKKEAAAFVCTLRTSGFETLCCLCSSNRGEDLKLIGDDANLRQPGREGE